MRACRVSDSVREGGVNVPGRSAGSYSDGVRIDLHTHSNASDGTDTPAQVMIDSARAGLDVVALTDHDTTSGWSEATLAAADVGLALVRGTEFSTRSRGISVHMLSYLHDPEHEVLADQAQVAQLAREARARKMVELLAEDYQVTWDDVVAQTVPGTVIGRPHLADALVAAGYVADRTVAFAQILTPNSPYYVPHFAPDPLDMITMIRAAGGVPVFAHPGADLRGRVVSDDTVREFADAGLGGLEVAHRDNSPAQQERLTGLAHELGLFMTGSSDYHGAGKPNRLGENTTPSEVFEEIEIQGRMRVLRP